MKYSKPKYKLLQKVWVKRILPRETQMCPTCLCMSMYKSPEVRVIEYDPAVVRGITLTRRNQNCSGVYYALRFVKHAEHIIENNWPEETILEKKPNGLRVDMNEYSQKAMARRTKI